MKCRVCHARKSPHRWTVQVCADGRKKRVFYLCDEHDLELNAHVLSFFHVPGAYNKIRMYGGYNTRLPKPQRHWNTCKENERE